MTASLVSIVALLIALVSTALGQVFYRARFAFDRKGYLVAAIGAFLVTPVMAYIALRELPLNLVYMSTAGTHVLVLMMGWVWLGERIDRERIEGVLLILVGLALYTT